jgi:hypothetical protein
MIHTARFRRARVIVPPADTGADALSTVTAGGVESAP